MDHSLSDKEKNVFNYIYALYKKNKYSEAKKQLLDSIKDFNNSFILNNLMGLIEVHYENYNASINYFKKSYQINNDFIEAKRNEAFTLIKLEKYEEGKEILKSIIKTNPMDLECYYSLGNIYYLEKKYSKAQKYFNKVIKKDKNFYKAYYAISRIYKSNKNYLESVRYCIKSLRIKNNFADAHYSISLVLLRKSKYKYGWQLYESRFSKTNPAILRGDPKRMPPEKIWKGNLEKKCSILFITEQGIGDSFQYIRYLEIFKKKGFQTLLISTPNICKILNSNQYIDQVYKHIDDVKTNFDYWLPLMSIPYRIYNEFKNIPVNIPYLFADTLLKQKWKNIIGDKINIGICWKGSKKTRDFNIEYLYFLQSKKNKIKLLSLQSDEENNAIQNSSLKNLMSCYTKPEDKINSFLDTAAIISNTHFVISCDTAVAHLSAAMGKKTILVLNNNHYWTWGENKTKSPWYPNMDIFHLDEIKDNKLQFQKKINITISHFK